jgi:ADP-heptose:LPS heptosyltransferase
LVRPDLIDEVLLLKSTFDIPSIRSARLIIATQEITETYILPYPSEASKRLWSKMLYLRILGIKGRIYGWRKSVPLQTPVAEAALSPLGADALARFRQGNLFYRLNTHTGVGCKILKDKLLKLAGAKFAVVYAGATHEHKRWPLANFVTLCRKLVGKFGFLIVLVGSKSEQSLHEKLKNEIGVDSCINVAGDTSLTDLAHILQSASLFIGNDGGIAHLASTVGTQTITIMSGIYPSGVWDPSGLNCMAVRVQGLPCIGCGSEDTCPAAHMLCIRSLSVNDVLAACLSRL